MKIHDAKTGCIQGMTGDCIIEDHYREMTFPEIVRRHIINLREGATTHSAVVLVPEAALRIAGYLEELLTDCERFERRLAVLEDPDETQG